MRALLACALLGCHSPTPIATTPPAPRSPWPAYIDWDKLPALADEPPFVPPPIVERSLPNGIRVIVVENHRLPLVSIATMHAAAGSREDGTAHGLAALTADALDEAPELASALEAEGARLDVAIASDYASVHATGLASHADELVTSVTNVIRRPRLLSRDVERIKAARLADLKLRDDRPRTLAALAFDRVVFQAHAYASPSDGTVATMQALDPDAVRSFYQSAYGPTSTTIIVAGDVAAQTAIASIEKAFGDWEVHEPATAPVAPGPAPAPLLGYIDRPGAIDCAVIIGKRASGAGGDRTAGDVANTILGGGLGSRLDRKLHDELHLTTGIASSYWRGQLAATWSIAFTTPTDHAAAAVAEVLAQLQTLRSTDPAPEELARAKSILSRANPIAFETTSGTARAIERLVAQGRPLDSLASMRDRIDAVTATSARSATVSWSDPTIIVVGDWKQIGPALSKLGLPVAQL